MLSMPGGLINVASELEGYNEERAHDQASKIYDTILDILDYSEENDTPTFVASNILAEKRIKDVGQIHQIYTSEQPVFRSYRRTLQKYQCVKTIDLFYRAAQK
ncbi:MAG: hypothetical protein U5J63_06640 [Fodinibius sp.]|nr:hypothetical protein [Fodinibius sp.]